MSDDSIRVWIVTDGKAGDAQQCRGVAERLGRLRPVVVDELVIADAAAREDRPDLAVTSGRRTLPLAKRLSKAGVFVAYLKRPRFPFARMMPRGEGDVGSGRLGFVWHPTHDGAGTNAFTTDLAPHPFTPERLAKARTGAERLTTIVLGGDSKSARWTEGAARSAGAEVAKLPPPFRLVTSRRTSPLLLDAMPDAEREDDYARALADASRIVVTGDSHNMVSEVLAAGVPVHLARPPQLARKFVRFLDSVEDLGLVIRLGQAERPSSGPIDETPAIAARLNEMFTAWAQGEGRAS